MKRGKSGFPVTGSWKRSQVLGLSLILALVGCGQGEEARPTIRIIGEGYPPLLAFEKVKDKFEQKYGIKVEVTKRDHMAVVAEIDREAASGVASYDLVVMPHRLLGRLVQQGYVQPIDEFLADLTLHDPAIVDPESDLIPGWWREISWYKGKPYGYPFMALSMYLWYREDLLEDPLEREEFQKRYGRELLPPTTWTEYAEVAEFFHRPSEGLYGTTLQGQRHVALWYEWLSYAIGFGGRIIDAQGGDEYGPVVIDSEANRQATEFYKGILAFTSREAPNHNWDDALAMFQQGRVALGIMWHDSAPWVEDPSESEVAGRIGYAPPPSLPGEPSRMQLEGHTFLIPRRSRHARDAFKLMEWTLGEEAQIEQTLLGGMSPRLSTYRDSRVQDIAYMKAFAEMVLTVDPIPKPKFPEAQGITEVMMRELSRLTSGERGDVSILLAKMQADVEALLKDRY